MPETTNGLLGELKRVTRLRSLAPSAGCFLKDPLRLIGTAGPVVGRGATDNWSRRLPQQSPGPWVLDFLSEPLNSNLAMLVRTSPPFIHWSILAEQNVFRPHCRPQNPQFLLALLVSMEAATVTDSTAVVEFSVPLPNTLRPRLTALARNSVPFPNSWWPHQRQISPR